MLTKAKIRDIYDDVEISVQDIMASPKQQFLDDLKDALNKLFPDSTCEGVIWTPNQDKLFFGLYVMPTIDADTVIKAITADRRYRVNSYYVELDGKLFGQFVGLSHHEITALIVHDVGALTNSSAPSEEVVKNIDQYLVDNHDSLKLSELIHYKEMLSFGFRDALRKTTSIFELGKYNPNEDTFADFIDWIPYSQYVTTALDKVTKAGYNYNREVDTKFIVLSWVLRVYKDVLGYRISALKTLERMEELTPSQIEKKELNNFARRLNRIDDDMLLESSGIKDPLLEEMRRTQYDFTTSNFVDSLDVAKNDLVGIILKQENLDTQEPDSIADLLGSINQRMMHIQDYVENNENDPVAFKQWNKMYKELSRRRAQLAKHKFYVQKRGMINTYKAQEDQ
jgi:hypothetical protein